MKPDYSKMTFSELCEIMREKYGDVCVLINDKEKLKKVVPKDEELWKEFCLKAFYVSGAEI